MQPYRPARASRRWAGPGVCVCVQCCRVTSTRPPLPPPRVGATHLLLLLHLLPRGRRRPRESRSKSTSACKRGGGRRRMRGLAGRRWSSGLRRRLRGDGAARPRYPSSLPLLLLVLRCSMGGTRPRCMAQTAAALAAPRSPACTWPACAVRRLPSVARVKLCRKPQQHVFEGNQLSVWSAGRRTRGEQPGVGCICFELRSPVHAMCRRARMPAPAIDGHTRLIAQCNHSNHSHAIVPVVSPPPRPTVRV